MDSEVWLRGLASLLGPIVLSWICTHTSLLTALLLRRPSRQAPGLAREEFGPNELVNDGPHLSTLGGQSSIL